MISNSSAAFGAPKCKVGTGQLPDVLFGRLPNKYPPLRIVATDIDQKGIKVFSKEATVGYPGAPDVAVADAVAASIAFPFSFSPKINAGRLLGDDWVSNLPMWLFDEDRREQIA